MNSPECDGKIGVEWLEDALAASTPVHAIKTNFTDRGNVSVPFGLNIYKLHCLIQEHYAAEQYRAVTHFRDIYGVVHEITPTMMDAPATTVSETVSAKVLEQAMSSPVTAAKIMAALDAANAATVAEPSDEWWERHVDGKGGFADPATPVFRFPDPILPGVPLHSLRVKHPEPWWKRLFKRGPDGDAR